MSRAGLVIAALTVVACHKNPQEPPITGLRIFERGEREIAGTFAERGASIDFTFKQTGTIHTAIIRSANGRLLIESTLAGRIQTTKYLGRVTVVDDGEVRIDGDASALTELAELPEARLVEPLRDALEQHGIDRGLLQAEATACPRRDGACTVRGHLLSKL